MKWYGIYCPQHGVWMQSSTGPLFTYPAREVAQAHLDMFRKETAGHPTHLFHVEQYGMEEFTPLHTLPPNSVLCAAVSYPYYGRPPHEDQTTEP